MNSNMNATNILPYVLARPNEPKAVSLVLRTGESADWQTYAGHHEGGFDFIGCTAASFQGYGMYEADIYNATGLPTEHMTSTVGTVTWTWDRVTPIGRELEERRFVGRAGVFIHEDASAFRERIIQVMLEAEGQVATRAS